MTSLQSHVAGGNSQQPSSSTTRVAQLDGLGDSSDDDEEEDDFQDNEDDQDDDDNDVNDEENEGAIEDEVWWRFLF